MKARLICCLLIALQMVSWVSTTSRHFQPNVGFGVQQAGQNPESSEITSKQGFKNSEEVEKIYEEANLKGVRKIGSSPPSCENKCYGCVPCEAIQVPTTSRHSHVGVQYANYEPEGWKCKCGPSFYSP
ncbi:EPIDERMAL PATTERNING FACTOR-like protein 3 [Ziziphus jujuba]|uniref:Epidermal patterning factor-like protein n=1 Tax=Ziziphus jujuba TaxID=326968 RepID=A0ABM3I1N8_ZIZJJ|nr:EPIDERMAL PATTERNING FACTOR-like protein 3 [Ziziphus jujuba var. spinosa]XP_048318770.1 EPIDERMAL PATTERNING FACTOR-like protein 3 [Ziziphus jujuba]